MKIEDLNSLIEAGTETQTLDFKGDCKWEAESFAKDILSMTNVQGGGKIIIGVAEKPNNTYEKVGVSPTNIETFKRDIMLDQMTKFADPHVSFAVEFISDENQSFVVISIDPFQEIPVICRKDSKETQIGAIYYRNRNKRPESAKISNSYDMRDILERAAVKLMQRAKQIGYEVPDTFRAVKLALKKELGDL